MVQLLNKFKNFRSIYYLIYVIIIIILIYLAYDLVNVLDTLRKWGWYDYFSELPALGSKFIYFVAFLLVFELGYENFIQIKNRRKLSSLEKEVTQLKAKLYDQEHSSEPEPSSQQLPSPDEEEDDEEDII